MVDKTAPHKSNTVLLVEWVDLPVRVSKWIFEESSDVLVCTPFLCLITRLFDVLNKLAEIAVCFLGQSSKI